MPDKTEIEVNVPEQTQKQLKKIKNMLVNAGYSRELNKYNEKDWFREVCRAGLLRDGDGNELKVGNDFSEEKPSKGLPESAANFIYRTETQAISENTVKTVKVILIP